MTNDDHKLTEEEFVLKAIRTLRKPGYKGIHSVFSGFNDAFRRYFGEDSSPINTTTRLAKEGKIVVVPRRGGVMLYLPEDAPSKDVANATLAKMGL